MTLTPPPAAPRSASPCISVCRMNESTRLCEGCLRTIDEIATWSLLDPQEREQVWREIDARRASAMSARDPAKP